jgi:Domain of unknown function (DUF3291)
MTSEPPKFPNQTRVHLAQINVALMKAPLNAPIMAEFAAALDEVNAIADQSAGFVWRLQTATGNATAISVYPDPNMLVNVSVWENIDSLKTYVYKSLHGDFFVRRRQWFEKLQSEHFAMWWIPAGHLPTAEEGKSKLEYLSFHGDSPEAFTFAQPYPSPNSSFYTKSGL